VHVSPFKFSTENEGTKHVWMSYMSKNMSKNMRETNVFHSETFRATQFIIDMLVCLSKEAPRRRRRRQSTVQYSGQYPCLSHGKPWFDSVPGSQSCVEVGSNTSTVALWVIGADKKGMTALARVSGNCKRQTRPLIRESAPYQQTRNCLTVIKIWSLNPRWVLYSKTHWPTDCRSYHETLLDCSIFFCFGICHLISLMFIYLDYTASNGWVNNELKKPYQGSGIGLIEVL
jgi:hypothetical protein